MNQPSGFEASIPVLTEVLQEADDDVPGAAPSAVMAPDPAPAVPVYTAHSPYAPAPAPQQAPMYFDALGPVPVPAANAQASHATPEYMQTAIPAGAYGAAAAALHDRGAQLEMEAGILWSEQDWQTLETRLSERILHQLQGRIDFVLEQRIRDAIFEVVSRTLGQLSDDIRGGVQHTVTQAVAAAVAHELAQLRGQPNRY